MSGVQVTHRQPLAPPLQFLQQAEQNIAQDSSTVIDIIKPCRYMSEEVSSSDIDHSELIEGGAVDLFQIIQ
ncbi:MAG: hypothetical protein E5W30_18230 [Mesorhizobium sp.]|nr:MAG: hypothetical protein E5W30_18230 [Mesorhizobium sp.]